MKKITTFIFLIILLTTCSEPGEEKISIEPKVLHESMQTLTDVIVHDIFSPPVASRVYVYPCIAAYEILQLENTEYLPLAGQLKDFNPIPKPDQPISYELAAIAAFLNVGQTLIFSEDKMEAYRNELYENLKTSISSNKVYENSISYGKVVADHILTWADKDNYKETRTFQKYTISSEPYKWQPTPPAYMEAIEPHWNKIRTFVIDSAQQFTPELPTEFDMTKGSTFYEEVMEVYDVVNNLDDEQSEIASFWDCNPYVMNVRGHVMFATKKITPGGHWIGIVKIACEKENASLIKTAEAYTLTALALADGFISCWDEKYRSNLIRPETVINTYIDEQWLPLLQTPPFPEYTSGHSVISGAAAVALTSVFGENFNFVDSTEVKYGLPPRNFTSFIDASDEAAVSRLYGGIHYRPAIDNGVTQGRALGKFIVDKLELHSKLN